MSRRWFFGQKHFLVGEFLANLALEVSALEFQKNFFSQLAQPHWEGGLFDGISDTVYFVKDISGRYVAANETLARRCGVDQRELLIGRTAQEVFPPPLGESFTQQDLALIAGGADICNQLELHLYPNGQSGWCLTWKKALCDSSGTIVGLSGVSRDLATTPDGSGELDGLSRVLSHIHDHLEEALTLDELAAVTGLSVFQIGQRIKRLFGLSPHQYIVRARIESARHLLSSTTQPLSEIALACGFGDQSSFTRQFKRSVGMTPRAYREQ